MDSHRFEDGNRADASPGAGTAAGPREEVRAAPAAPAAAAPTARPGVDDTCTHAERSAIYHKAREGFLDACHRATMFLVILSSSAAAARAAGGYGAVALALLLLPAILGALDMAFAFGFRAREHAILARRFLELAAECSAPEADGPAVLAKFYRLCSEEPPTYRAVDALAHNQVCDALGRGGLKMVVPRFARLLRHVLRHSATEFPVVGRA